MRTASMNSIKKLLLTVLSASSLYLGTAVFASTSSVDYEDLLRQASTELKKKNYNKAIMLLLHIHKNSAGTEQRRAHKLLGIAHEENNQLSKATQSYEQFIERYKRGEDVQQVRQRLSLLLLNDNRPKTRLKYRKKTYSRPSSKTFGLFSQHLSYNQSRFAQQEQVEQYYVINQLNLQNRTRNTAGEWSTRLYASHQYKLHEQENQPMKVNKLFLRYKSNNGRLSSQLGRHLSNQFAFSERLDGVSMRVRLGNTMELSGLGGYPVSYMEKHRVQTEKPMAGLALGFYNLFDRLNITAYTVQENYQDHINRQALGLRSQLQNRFGMIEFVTDYDYYFKALNAININGNQQIANKTHTDFGIQFYRSPYLQLDQAMYYQEQLLDFKQLLSKYDEEQLIQQAREKVSSYRSAHLGFRHEINKDLKLGSRISLNFIKLAAFTAETRLTEKEYRGNINLSYNYLAWRKNTLLANIYFTRHQHYDNWSSSLRNRIVLSPAWQLQPGISFSYILRDNGETISKSQPSLRIHQKARKNISNQIELAYYDWRYGGNSKNNDLNYFYVNVSYQYFF